MTVLCEHIDIGSKNINPIGWVRPGTTITHLLLPLTPITIKPPTTDTTYYDGWRQCWASMVDVSLRLQWVAVVVRPGTTATHHLLSLTPITIKPPTTATTYYDGWQRWWVSMVVVSLRLQWEAVVVTPGTTTTHHLLSLTPITINPPT